MKNYSFLFRDPFAFVLIAAVAATLLSWLAPFLEKDPTPLLQGIQRDYSEGLAATTSSARQEAFNRSIESLLMLEKDFNPTSGNGNLYLQIGDSYFQLQEYPRAILYYYRALNLRPNDKAIKEHLAAAQKQLNINQPVSDSAIKRVFFWHTMLSVPERLQLFSLLTVLLLGAASGYLWYNNRKFYLAGIILSALTGLILLSLVISYYFTPMEAVVITSSPIYRDAGEQFATVTDAPLVSGLKVRVLDVANAGNWLKIETANGIVGYVPYKSLQIV